MKIARGKELLTSEQRQALMQIPKDERGPGTYYTFSKRGEKKRSPVSQFAINSYQKHPKFNHTLYVETNRCISILKGPISQYYFREIGFFY